MLVPPDNSQARAVRSTRWQVVWRLAFCAVAGVESLRAGMAAAESEHWAFQPLQEVDAPAGTEVHPVDAFIQPARHQQSLAPNPLAERRILLRRLSFDLHGLPPSPSLVDQFLQDQRPDAIPRLVDRLLASPQYGERWGRYWMDVVRYADTAGDNADYPIPEIYYYRDYIIDAFNRDTPYDQFVREQLAGDLIATRSLDIDAQRYKELVVATGFLALSRRYGTMPYEHWHLTLEDTIDTVGRAFLGMTLKCARCHDHKFDAISTQDYYGLYGIFASTQFPWAGGEEVHSKRRSREHFVPLLRGASLNDAKAKYDRQQSDLQRQIDMAPDDETRQRLERRLQLMQRSGLPPDMPGAYAVHDRNPIDSPIHLQGDPALVGETVHRSVPAFLSIPRPQIPGDASGRMQLAKWITDRDNPLFSRVMVNRIWQHLFGRGLISTPSNLGRRGGIPTHPQLLDYLADRFIASNYSIKSMQRLIVTSRTYQLSSDYGPENMLPDPDNEFYWRHDRRRLDAEALRDTILWVSGSLDLGLPGPHPFPPIETWNWTQHDAFKQVYDSNHRSVYLMTQRLQRHPFLAHFDGPDTNTTTDVRTQSIVPSQALYLTNNPWMRAQAIQFARLLIAATDDTTQRMTLAYQRAFSRQPARDELSHWEGYCDQLQVAAESSSATRAELDRWTSIAHILLCSSEFVYVD